MITRIRLVCEIESTNNVALIKLCCPRYNETHSQVCKMVLTMTILFKFKFNRRAYFHSNHIAI